MPMSGCGTAAPGSFLNVLSGHRGPVFHPVFLTRTAGALTGRDDGTLRSWDVTDGAAAHRARPRRRSGLDRVCPDGSLWSAPAPKARPTCAT